MTPGTIGIALALGITAILAIVIFIRAHVVVCAPNEAVIFSGRKKGYRIVRGGRGFRRPLLETVSRISLNTIPIEVTVKKALSAGMISLNVDGMATVKISGDPKGGLENAVERFLGRSQHEIQSVARQTLEGSLRGVLATRSPEEANAERLGVAEAVSESAQKDFSQLGLVLDTFKIQNLSDTEGYLDAIGRKRSAMVRRDAKVAEARADSEARDVAANARMDAVVAETKAEEAIVDAEHRVRMRRAERAATANQAEQVAEVAKRMSRVEEERRLEAIRVERNKLRESANTIVPAEAASQAQELTSRGEASRIRENGKATAQALAEIKAQWTDDTTREIMLLQMLPQLLDKVTHVLHDNLHVERLTVVDSGGGDALPNHVRGLTGSIAAFPGAVEDFDGRGRAGAAPRQRKRRRRRGWSEARFSAGPTGAHRPLTTAR